MVPGGASAAESLRDGLRNEELKIAFMKNKLEVYESLVWLSLKHADDGAAARSIFELHGAGEIQEPAGPDGEWSAEREAGGPEAGPASRIRELREELNWYYHRIELEQLSQEGASEEQPGASSRRRRGIARRR